MSAVALPVLSAPVQPAAVTCGADRFKCEPMHAVITAAECKKRHAAAHVSIEGRSRRVVAARQAANSAAACKGCKVGPTHIHPKVTS